MLGIKNLCISIEDKKILKGINLTINTGEIHTVMGPNGIGKPTLSAIIMGDPSCEITEGEILFDGVNVLDLEIDKRAHLGSFLAMQYPSEIPGITNVELMCAAINIKCDEDNKMSVMQFLKKLNSKMELLNTSEEMTKRYLNEGFSNGERKRNEILQLLMLEPTLVILDEIDSGLGIDVLKVVSRGIDEMRDESFDVLAVTHYQHLLNYITPGVVHIMMEGRAVRTSGADLARRLEIEGYAGINQELDIGYREKA